MRPLRLALTLASIVALAAFAWPVTLPAQVTGWHQWRGPNRDGHSLETGLLQAWPPDGPSLVWSANGAGIGYSSLSAAHGRLYTLGNQDGSEFVVAFDASTGERLWTTAHGRRFNNEEGDGPRSTPTVIGDRLYVLGARGDLTCPRSGDWADRLVGQRAGAVR